MITKLLENTDLLTWKQKFCETFANKEWSLVMCALTFKYKEGPLLDYAIKNEKNCYQTPENRTQVH